MLEGIQREPPEHVGGVVALPIGRLGVGVLMGHDGKEKHRGPDEEFERDGSTRGR